MLSTDPRRTLAVSRPQPPAPSTQHRLAAFTLIEVLLAIFILGIGVISIAALFPAGIAQQRLSVDDSLGPVVANAAFDVIKSRVRPLDFGTYEEHGLTPNLGTIPGDWTWGRPSYFFAPDNVSTPNGSIAVPAGSISIFNHPNADTTTPEIPWSFALYGSSPPGVPPNTSTAPFIITQRERYYPIGPTGTSTETARPQYVWDCMFRRFQGRVLVAIFVYRVTLPGGTSIPYIVPPQPAPNEAVPQIPLSLNLVIDPGSGTSPPYYNDCGAWSTANLPGGGGADDDSLTPLNVVQGTVDGTPYDTTDIRQSWQEPRQWLLDQNNNIHRVIGQSRNSYTTHNGNVFVELSRAPAPVLGFGDTTATPPESSGTPFYYFVDPGGVSYPLPIAEGVVTNIWYIPTELLMDVNFDGTPETRVTLTPVYVTVKEL
jgi:hypothetical protein